MKRLPSVLFIVLVLGLSASSSALIYAGAEAACASDSRAKMFYDQAMHDLHKSKTLDRALSNIDQAIKIEPKNSDFATAKAAILMKMDECEAALTWSGTATKLNPKNWEAWHLRAEILTALKQNAEALESINKAEAIAGKPAEDCVKADILTRLGRLGEAEKELDRLLVADKRRVGPRSRRAEIYIKTKQYEKAIPELSTLIDDSEHVHSKVVNICKRAECHMQLKQYQKVIEDYQLALKTSPDNRIVHANLLDVYKKTGDTKHAQAEQKYLDSMDQDYIPIK